MTLDDFGYNDRRRVWRYGMATLSAPSVSTGFRNSILELKTITIIKVEFSMQTIDKEININGKKIKFQLPEEDVATKIILNQLIYERHITYFFVTQQIQKKLY